MADAGEIFAQYPPGSWTILGDKITFIVKSIRESGGARIVRRARPYRAGAKLDSTGPKEKVWVVETLWENSLDEPGVEQIPVLYPNRLHSMLETVGLDQTGTLVLPTRGPIRCRLETYERTESDQHRDCARVTFTFVEDNEDKVDANSFQTPSVRATVRRATDETVFSMNSVGVLAQLEDFATSLEEAIAAPGELVQDVDQKAARMVRAIDGVVRQFSISSEFGRDRLTDPDSHAAVRQARILQDRIYAAFHEKNAALPRIITIAKDRVVSLYDVATELAQDPSALLAINNRLEDALWIEAGTLINVFDPNG